MAALAGNDRSSQRSFVSYGRKVIVHIWWRQQEEFITKKFILFLKFYYAAGRNAVIVD